MHTHTQTQPTDNGFQRDTVYRNQMKFHRKCFSLEHLSTNLNLAQHKSRPLISSRPTCRGNSDHSNNNQIHSTSTSNDYDKNNYHQNNNNNNKNNNNSGIERCNLIISTTSSVRCKLSPTCTLKWPWHKSCENHVQIMCNTLGAHHVQHVMCHLLQSDSSAIKFDRV